MVCERVRTIEPNAWMPEDVVIAAMAPNLQHYSNDDVD